MDLSYTWAFPEPIPTDSEGPLYKGILFCPKKE